jgi:hypothetical protein
VYFSDSASSGLGAVVPNPDNMPTNPLPPRPPIERMPTNPLLPEYWCPELKYVRDGVCYAYEPSEIAVSRTAAGQLTPDVVLVDPGAALLPPSQQQGRALIASCFYLIVRDFGVDWRHVKRAATEEPRWKAFLARFKTDSSLTFRLLGYSDCVGAERHNSSLRKCRALNVAKLFGPARSRILAVSAAPANQYLVDNSTKAGRANNRSVVIQVFKNSSGGSA